MRVEQVNSRGKIGPAQAFRSRHTSEQKQSIVRWACRETISEDSCLAMRRGVSAKLVNRSLAEHLATARGRSLIMQLRLEAIWLAQSPSSSGVERNIDDRGMAIDQTP